MFTILDDKTICLTRGDTATIQVELKYDTGLAVTNGTAYLRIMEKKDCTVSKVEKSVGVVSGTASFSIVAEDTKESLCPKIINKPIDFWYEVSLETSGVAQTVIGYDEEGPKIFRVYPEGGAKES